MVIQGQLTSQTLQLARNDFRLKTHLGATVYTKHTDITYMTCLAVCVEAAQINTCFLPFLFIPAASCHSDCGQ